MSWLYLLEVNFRMVYRYLLPLTVNLINYKFLFNKYVSFQHSVLYYGVATLAQELCLKHCSLHNEIKDKQCFGLLWNMLEKS